MSLPQVLKDAYSTAPRKEQLHVAGRWRTCPFAAVEPHIPKSGRIMEIGCGHGLFCLYMATESPEREVTGVDVDEDKIPFARQAAEHAGLGNVTFDVVAPDAMPSGEWDAVTIVDVLYLLGAEGASRLVTAAAEVLAPGGVLVIKEMAERPRWKYAVNQFQEILATKVIRITEGDHVEVVPPVAIVADIEKAGLTVTEHPVDKGFLHPHHLIVGRRPAA